MTTTIRSSADGSKSYIQVGGTDRVTIGSQGIEAGSFKPGAIAANDLADGALIENSVNGIGYGIGAGGTVTQATSKSTAVTLNKPTGRITMNNAALAAGVSVGFRVNNSFAETADAVVLTVAGGGIIQNYNVWTQAGQTGAFTVFVRNISADSLSDALGINFAIIKGVMA